ncbi:MAG: Uma2 family endonuclease [Acidobacteriota bacterium]|jgi:Uma2 family endonuclease|nr:Uma2 family endonuclease [Acidobacteriota bacterium]
MGLAKLETHYYTIEEYLELERKADERSEFIDGEIYSMAGETGKHGDVSANFLALVVTGLRGSDCRARTKDTKVKSGALKKQFGKGMISYPDIVVICGEPEYHDKHKDVVPNPTVIIEVLSESTEEFDRGVKFMRYRNFNETLTDYILVSQDEPLIEHYIKQENGDWLLKEYKDLDTTFQIISINCSLTLKDIYDRIEF